MPQTLSREEAPQLLHYRPWRGELRSSATTIWPIARVALGMMIRRKLFWVLYVLGLMFFLLFFFGQYLLAYAESISSAPNGGGGLGGLIRILRNLLDLDGSGKSYRTFFNYQGHTVMVILALAGATLIGNDLRFGSLPFYLSKPVSRWHYLAGKALAVAVFVNLLTTLPGLILWVQYGLLAGWNYYADNWELAVGIVAYGASLSVSLSLLLLATAVWLRKTVPLIMVWSTLFLFLRIVTDVLVTGLNFDRHWRLFNLWNDNYLVGSACLGVEAPNPLYHPELVLGGPGSGRSESDMPDVLDPADSGRGSHPVNAERGMRNAEVKTTAVAAIPHSAIHIPHSAFGPPVLVCERVSKWYGPVIGVNQVTLELRPGITGLVGSNGAGKTTLMRLITGQLRPDIGRVEICGLDAWSAAAKRHVGYCPEIDVFYEEMSGRQFVETMARLCGYTKHEARRRTEEALEQVGMAGRAERTVAGYSKGMRQRIKLAQALLHDPVLLILDEPMSGIDPVGRQEFVQLAKSLAERGKCLLISSHELEELEKLTDHVTIMARGRIAAVGTLGQLRDRLDHHPLSIRIEIAHTGEEPGDSGRDFAAALLRQPDVIGVELAEDVRPEDHISRVLVRARNPQRFYKDLSRLVVEEGYDVTHLETLDDSTEAVLSYLLGR